MPTRRGRPNKSPPASPRKQLRGRSKSPHAGRSPTRSKVKSPRKGAVRKATSPKKQTRKSSPRKPVSPRKPAKKPTKETKSVSSTSSNNLKKSIERSKRRCFDEKPAAKTKKSITIKLDKRAYTREVDQSSEFSRDEGIVMSSIEDNPPITRAVKKMSARDDLINKYTQQIADPTEETVVPMQPPSTAKLSCALKKLAAVNVPAMSPAQMLFKYLNSA